MSTKDPKPLRIEGDELSAPVERVEQALEHYFDHEQDAPFERIDLMTLTADDDGGVDIIATAGGVTVQANITARAIETGHIAMSLRRLARMLRGES